MLKRLIKFNLCALMVVLCATPLQAGTIAASNAAQLAEEWGIQLVDLRLSAAGYMLDFRYRVLDADKANSLLLRKNKPKLTIQSTGRELAVPVPPKLGPMRQTTRKVKADTNYFIFFGNPARQVKSGDKVNIRIGDLEITGLKVS